MGGEPYCGKCGYQLQGLEQSSKCPECGEALVNVLMRKGFQYRQGRRYKSDIRVFGLPLLHIAQGPHGDEMIGRARGIIAIGDLATGWFAMGGRAIGIFAVGGLAVGLFAIGGFSFGLFVALGGGAAGGLALGGGAVGAIASGGGTIGYVAEGGGALGIYARGGGVAGAHVLSPIVRDPQAVEFFREYAWFFGDGLRPGIGNLALGGWALIIMFISAILVALVALIGYWRAKSQQQSSTGSTPPQAGVKA